MSLLQHFAYSSFYNGICRNMAHTVSFLNISVFLLTE